MERLVCVHVQCVALRLHCTLILLDEVCPRPTLRDFANRYG